jgi:hypothetical protein
MKKILVTAFPFSERHGGALRSAQLSELDNWDLVLSPSLQNKSKLIKSFYFFVGLLCTGSISLAKLSAPMIHLLLLNRTYVGFDIHIEEVRLGLFSYILKKRASKLVAYPQNIEGFVGGSINSYSLKIFMHGIRLCDEVACISEFDQKFIGILTGKLPKLVKYRSLTNQTGLQYLGSVENCALFGNWNNPPAQYALNNYLPRLMELNEIHQCHIFGTISNNLKDMLEEKYPKIKVHGWLEPVVFDELRADCGSVALCHAPSSGFLTKIYDLKYSDSYRLLYVNKELSLFLDGSELAYQEY